MHMVVGLKQKNVGMGWRWRQTRRGSGTDADEISWESGRNGDVLHYSVTLSFISDAL